MSNKAFQQNLDDKKGPQPGGPYLIQMLFKVSQCDCFLHTLCTHGLTLTGRMLLPCARWW